MTRPTRLVLLSLDGLSNRAFQNMVADSGFLKHLAREPYVVQQTYWARLLGHRDGKFLDKYELSEQILVNCPLVHPEGERKWLSDGSVPSAQAVSPNELAKIEPFRSYRAAPYSSSAAAIGMSSESLMSALNQVFRNRLNCVKDLIARDDWKICIARFNEFDLINHSACTDELVREWCDEWSQAVCELLEGRNDMLVAALSFFEHRRCIGRVKLNRFLEAQALCTRSPGVDAEKRRRHEAALALGETPILVDEFQPDMERSVAYSPSAGQVRVLRKDRLHEVEACLRNGLRTRFGDIVEISSTGQEDIFIRIDGVEFSNERSGPTFDFENKPLRTHVNNGWFWSSRELSSLRGQDEIATHTIGDALLHTCL